MLDLGISGSVTGTARPTPRDKRSGSLSKLPAIRDAGSSEINLSGRSSGSSGRGVLSGIVSKSPAGVDVMDLKIAKLKSQSNEVRGNIVRSNAGHAAGRDMDGMGVSGANFDGNAEGGGIATSSAQAGAVGAASGAGMNTRQGDIIFDSNAFNGVEAAHAPVPDRKPKGMQRAKTWTCDVENMFRFQLAGWRDMHEYMSVHSPPAVWEDVGFIRCLQNKVGNFMYFRQSRECEIKHLAKVKLYTY